MLASAAMILTEKKLKRSRTTHTSAVLLIPQRERQRERERERARDTGELKKKRWEFKTAEDSSPSLSIGSRLLSEAPAAP